MVLERLTQDDHLVLGLPHHAAEDHRIGLLHVAMLTLMYQEGLVVEEGEEVEVIVVAVLSAVLIPNLDLGRLYERTEEPAQYRADPGPHHESNEEWNLLEEMDRRSL